MINQYFNNHIGAISPKRQFTIPKAIYEQFHVDQLYVKDEEIGLEVYTQIPQNLEDIDYMFISKISLDKQHRIILPQNLFKQAKKALISSRGNYFLIQAQKHLKKELENKKINENQKRKLEEILDNL